MSDYEPAVVASVLKQFLRELPDPVLTNHLMLKFEDVSALTHPQKRIEGMKALLAELPECNRYISFKAKQETQNKKQFLRG